MIDLVVPHAESGPDQELDRWLALAKILMRQHPEQDTWLPILV